VFRDGRWFWWLAAGCLCVLVADITEVGPFAESERRQEVEVLGDSVERESVTTTTTTSTTSTTVALTSTTLSEAEALEQLQGLDQDTLDALEGIKGVDPAQLTSTTTR
jgi:hypothetical protein